MRTCLRTSFSQKQLIFTSPVALVSILRRDSGFHKLLAKVPGMSEELLQQVGSIWPQKSFEGAKSAEGAESSSHV